MSGLRSTSRFLHAAWPLLACAAATALGQPAADPRGGGLVPGGSGTQAGLTRDELIRNWDLNGDGTISNTEADLARVRMRRQRLEMQLGTGLDPLTGLPRNAAAEFGPDDDGDEPVFRLPPEIEPPRDSRPPPAAERSGRASWLPPRPLGPATTGGLRAGGPAAVPGYGGSQQSDLNAGRRPVDRLAAPPTGGGLVPAGRPPGRTGAIILPGQRPGSSLPPGRGVPPPPPPPSSSPPRITAEEMGGYRP